MIHTGKPRGSLRIPVKRLEGRPSKKLLLLPSPAPLSSRQPWTGALFKRSTLTKTAFLFPRPLPLFLHHSALKCDQKSNSLYPYLLWPRVRGGWRWPARDLSVPRTDRRRRGWA